MHLLCSVILLFFSVVAIDYIQCFIADATVEHAHKMDLTKHISNGTYFMHLLVMSKK